MEKKPRTMRLSEETWEGLSELRLYETSFISWEELFTLILDQMYHSAFCHSDHAHEKGFWKELRKNKLKKTNEEFLRRLKEIENDEGKVNSREASEIVMKLEKARQVLCPPYSVTYLEEE